MKPRLFVQIGGVANGDFDRVHRLAEKRGTTEWSCLKSAQRGDRCLIYIQRPCSALLAEATILAPAVPGKPRKWKFVAKTGNFKLIPNPLTIQALKREFPRWAWLRYPRSKAIVPEQYAKRLWKLVHGQPKKEQTAEPGRGAGFGDAKTNRLVEKAAIRKVTCHLRRQGYRVVSREKDGVGYDLEATKGRRQIHVEVKGISGDILQFPITRQEVNRAGSDPAFRLVVATRPRTQQARLKWFTGRQFRKLFHLSPLSYLASQG